MIMISKNWHKIVMFYLACLFLIMLILTSFDIIYLMNSLKIFFRVINFKYWSGVKQKQLGRHLEKEGRCPPPGFRRKKGHLTLWEGLNPLGKHEMTSLKSKVWQLQWTSATYRQQEIFLISKTPFKRYWY